MDTEADLEPPTPAGVEPDAIAVLLVDDHDVILDGLTAMLRSYAARVQILGRARTGAEALAALSRGVTPDVVLLDVKLRAESGLDLCRELLHRSPEVKVVFFTVYDDEQYLFQALRMGASGYLLKQTRGAELVDHLEAVIAGRSSSIPSSPHAWPLLRLVSTPVSSGPALGSDSPSARVRYSSSSYVACPTGRSLPS